MMEPVSQENEAAVCASMVAGCEAALEGFDVSLADDLRALGELGDDTSAQAVALRVRTVRTLHAAIAAGHSQCEGGCRV